MDFNAAEMQAKQDHWRKRGPLGKLHNIIQYIYSSSQHRDAWSEVKIGQHQIDDLWPVKDNTTRWNSQYNAIEAAIRLRPRLKVFLDIHRDDLRKDVLSDDDWDELQELHDSLEPFYDITIAIQSRASDGRHGSLWEWLPAIECLKNELEASIEKAKADGTQNTPITIARKNAWAKLDKYWKKTENAHTLYAAATLMCPEQRVHYFDREWNTVFTAKEKDKMIKKVRKHWVDNYRDQPTDSERPTKRVSLFDRHLNRAPVTSSTSNDFDEYITGMPISLVDREATTLLRWWCNIGPHSLRQMALDFLSIPCTSCECERAFSSARRTMSWERMSVHEGTVEEVELLRNWWRQGIIEQPSAESYIDGDDDIDDLFPDEAVTSDTE